MDDHHFRLHKKIHWNKHYLGDLGWDLGRPVAVTGKREKKKLVTDLEPYPSLFQTLPVQVPIQVTFSGE
jgi:hypothetical protein